MHRIRLLAAVAIVVSPLAIPPPSADAAGVLCSWFGQCGHFHLTAGSDTYVTVECGDDYTKRVHPGESSPKSCDAAGFRVPKSGWKMYRRVVQHDGFVQWVRLENGHRYGISDGVYFTARKLKA